MQSEHVYIIGEIGQNHNGSVDIAKLIVDLVSRPVHDDIFGMDFKPMDAIKLVKRDLDEELSQSMRNKVYESQHSFGATYGEHRRKLELSDEQHHEIYSHAKTKGLDVVETLCAIGTLKILKYFSPDKLKVASRDLTNLPLLAALAETRIPIILSTGMAGTQELDTALDIIAKHHDQISILHCVSEYPTKPQNVSLLTISYLIENYPKYIIGYSDHTIGISAPIGAVALGARIIEKHVTIDRKMKGSDQAGSLGPDGVNRMIRDIRITELSMGEKKLFIEPDVIEFKNKLERSIATKRALKAGHIIGERDVHMLSPGDGFRWSELNEVLGKKCLIDIPKDEIIYREHLIDA
ncbi:MAG: sialic acid synthase [Ignavibacteriaceae bacterium]|nr:MAG: sialic acid synthase [Ignavibacteriaceae bacterium]